MLSFDTFDIVDPFLEKTDDETNFCPEGIPPMKETSWVDEESGIEYTAV